MGQLTIYGDSRSGNCQKVRYTADFLNIPYAWQEIDVLARDTRSPEFLKVNPAGQVPAVLLADGRPLTQSGAILLHLAEDSVLIPGDAYQRALMLQWMFWEQYSHEPVIAVRRFQRFMLNRPEHTIDPRLMERGEAALQLMERHLTESFYFVGGTITLADIALVAYTRLAPEGGFPLAPYKHVREWIARVEQDLRLPAMPFAFAG